MSLIAKNRRAWFDYEILEEFEAGIVLYGSEVKSIRDGRVQLSGSYAKIQDGELYLINAHISPYEKSRSESYNPLRDRKLLVKKIELNKLMKKTEIRGLTLVPTRMYFKGGWAKVAVGLARGKKKADKRSSLKEQDARREMDRERKRYT
ncbi:MAG: SsrA-binding protein SmpB [Elusimicrobia bacterium]|nr:SsrA-binding protein SmpB [Elusimicrobiota bacterium]